MKTTESRLYIIIIIVLLLSVILKDCRTSSETKIPVQKIDTAWHNSKEIIIKEVQPVKIINEIPEQRTPKIVYNTDVDTVIIIQPTDTASILKDYFSTAIYQDTVTLAYGKVFIHDSIRKNMIASRKVYTDFNIPVVTKTNVINDKRNQVYVGLGALGSEQNIIKGLGPELALKTKTGNIISIGGYTNLRAERQYRFSYYKLITLKKQK